MKAALLVLVLGSACAFGQDAGMMAAQQATQAAQMANQQAMQDMQMASQQASQQMMQNATDASLNPGPSVAVARQPAFSVKAGVVAPETTVRIKCPTRYAVIYFTTNGWTPTSASRRYRGPISITGTTQLQAIAIAPNMVRSPIAIANYTVNAPVTPVYPLTLAADGVLRARTRLHLVTNSTVNSKTAEVGDSISILLDQDVKLGDAIVIPRGTPVDATITQADSSGHMGAPGDLAFEVDSITARGATVPLFGGETLEGANHYSKVRGLILIPVAGAAGLLVRGDDAEIKPGMTFTAAVAEDTPLNP
ncbi:MAG: chitobiase/beta-hexosaminidase C-terminal domain-containing protein [Terracidiphilus sp.]